ncbi:MAG: trypsin-like serine protease [Rhizobiales bacterium]|nr:trypsin-like serine protease [Hyphomicrobiales bacterium]
MMQSWNSARRHSCAIIAPILACIVVSGLAMRSAGAQFGGHGSGTPGPIAPGGALGTGSPPIGTPADRLIGEPGRIAPPSPRPSELPAQIPNGLPVVERPPGITVHREDVQRLLGRVIALPDRSPGFQPGVSLSPTLEGFVTRQGGLQAALDGLSFREHKVPGDGRNGDPGRLPGTPSLQLSPRQGSLPLQISPRPASGGAASESCEPDASAPAATCLSTISELGAPIGRRAAYCRNGFRHVVMIQPAVGSGIPRVCSGTLITERHVVTAGHCVGAGGLGEKLRVYLTQSSDDACLAEARLSASRLARANPPPRHPADACNLLGVDASRVITMSDVVRPSDDEVWRGLDLAVIELASPITDVARAAGRSAIFNLPIIGTPVGGPEICATIAGYGAVGDDTDAERGPGRFSLSYLADTPGLGRVARGEQVADNRLRLEVIDDGSTWRFGIACSGDSGGPVFAGILRGYANEPQILLAVAVNGATAQNCRDALRAKGLVVPLVTPMAKRLLCQATGNILEICKP